MNAFNLIAILVSLTALFGYLNERYSKLPTPIGVMLVGLLASLLFLLLGNEASSIWAQEFLHELDFGALVMQGLLAFLLFAGALTVNLDDLSSQGGSIMLLATLGVLLSTFIVGTLSYSLLAWLGIGLPFSYALLFGALISPTDPIAVLSIFKRVGLPKDVEALVVGESLFNDGVGVVVFTLIAGLIGMGSANHGETTTLGVVMFFYQEALGGLVFGFILGLLAFHMLKRVDNYSIEVLITLAVVTGGYSLAQILHTSGPLAMVVAGLFIGNQGRLFAMSDTTREHLDAFWEMTDEMLNAILFVLIGLEVLAIKFDALTIEAAFIAVPVVLLARFISVSLPIALLRLRRDFLPYTVRTMVWGGLRGGISIALALSLSEGPEKQLIMVMTYGVVVFAIVVQGLSIERLAQRIPRPNVEL